MSYPVDPHKSSVPPFPPADHPILAEFADPPRRSNLGFVAGMLLILIIVAIVVGPLLYFALPGEMVRWQIASAEEKRLNGDIDGAIQDLNEALAKEPTNTLLLRKRAEWHIEEKDYSAALKDCNELLKLRPDDMTLLVLRSQVLQHLGRHAEAVADWKSILRSDVAQLVAVRADVLNGLAYARALANVEIDQGLADIDEAIRKAGERYHYIDTRGFLYYRDGDFERALKDLDRAVENAEEEYAAWLVTSKKGRLGVTDDRQMKQETEQAARIVAVIRYHRGLVQRARGEADSAEQDFRRVRELGFEPNDKLF